jgi:hypothetical protein
MIYGLTESITICNYLASSLLSWVTLVPYFSFMSFNRSLRISEMQMFSFRKALLAKKPYRRASAMFPPPMNPQVFGNQTLVPSVKVFILPMAASQSFGELLNSLF